MKTQVFDVALHLLMRKGNTNMNLYIQKYVPCMSSMKRSIIRLPHGIIKVSCLNITINYTNLIGFLIPRLVSMYIIYLVRFHQYTRPTLVVVVFSCWWRFWAWHVIETYNSLQHLCKLYFMHEVMRGMLLHLCVGIMNFLNQITQGCDLESLKLQLRFIFRK